MEIQTLNGLGCGCNSPALGCPGCNGKCGGATPQKVAIIAPVSSLGTTAMAMALLNGFGAAADYDIIVVGGEQYKANQIVDRQLTAGTRVAIYNTTKTGAQPSRYIEKGQIIGKVYSYLKASGPTGRAALMFWPANQEPYYVFDEKAVDTVALKDQGVKTVKQEVKEEQAAAQKDNDPFMYYLKKIGVPLGLGIAGVIIVNGLFRETIRGFFNKSKADEVKKEEPAPAAAAAPVGKVKTKKQK